MCTCSLLLEMLDRERALWLPAYSDSILNMISCSRVLECLPDAVVNALHHGLDLCPWPQLMQLSLA